MSGIRAHPQADAGPTRFLAPAGTAMAMLTCYGISAVVGVLSLLGISLALPYRGPLIVVFSAIAAGSLVASYRQHRSIPVLVLGLLGFALIAASKFAPHELTALALATEGAGFACLLAGNFAAARARRMQGVVCNRQYPT